MTLLSSVVIICNIYIKYRLCSGKLQWKIAVEQSQIIVDFTYFEVNLRIWNSPYLEPNIGSLYNIFWYFKRFILIVINVKKKLQDLLKNYCS